MNTIALCFKPLLYPQPVVLKYLPTLLKLSLPGVDASDAVSLQCYMMLSGEIGVLWGCSV